MARIQEHGESNPQVCSSSAAPGVSCSSSNPRSGSRSITKTINGSHHFVINGYSLAKGMGVGKYIASDTFTVGGYQWAIYFYPDGKNPEDNSLYVSIFIALASDGTDVRALFELTLRDQSGKGKHKVHSHFDRALESGPYTLKYRGSMWGYKRFFRRAALETSDYLKDDSLDIYCTVGVVETHIQGPKQCTVTVPMPDLGQHLLSFLENGTGCDVSFEVDGEIFHAHKLILAARSPVFNAQLYGPLRDRNTDKIQIEDIEAPVFKAMLHFIYTDALPDMHDLLDTTPLSTSTVMAQHLLAAADRYGLDRLRLLCESKLCDEITIDTVATTLALAEQHHSYHLKSMCLKFAAAPENLGAVMQTEGYEYLQQSCPALLSQLLETVAGVEDDVKLVGRKRSSILMVSSDGSDANGRRVRQRTHYLPHGQ